MEVMPGYKQTEVGVIPQDWTTATLGDLVEPASPICYGVVQVGPNTEGGVPIVAIKYVKEIANAPLHRASSRIERPYSRSRIKPGDVLISIKGTIGRIGVVPSQFEGNISRDLARLRLKQVFCPAYVAHQLECGATQDRIASAVVGTTRLEFSIAALRQFVIPIPGTFAEQNAIAGALSDADAQIESLEQLVFKQRQVKRGAMQELLTGQKRLPSFTGEWKPKRLGELGKCHRGVSYNPVTDLSAFDTPRTVRLLRSNNVEEAQVVLSDIQFVDCSRVANDQLLQDDDILICMANGSRDLVGKAGRFITNDEYRYTFGAFMGAFRPDHDAVDVGFAFHLFQTEAYRRHIAILLAGSSINNLTPGSIEALELPVPADVSEQQAIASVLSDMDAEIVALEMELAKAQQVKQGMMQQLLTGKVRLI